MRISTTIDSGQRDNDSDATTLTGSPAAIADRLHQYRAAGVDEFVLGFTVRDHCLELQQTSDNV